MNDENSRAKFLNVPGDSSANYTSGEALGTVKAQTWGAAKNVHSTKCGGDDGELHVGALDGGLSLPTSQTPLSGKAFDDDDWGVVFELPDAKAGKGPATLTKHQARPSRSPDTFASGTRVTGKAKSVALG
jgi:hypothetical protein